MDHVTPIVPRVHRSARRQAVLACALTAYLVAFLAGVLALASLAAPTGAAAIAALAVAGVVALAGAALWSIDAVTARRRAPATVAFLTPMGTSVVLPARRIAG